MTFSINGQSVAVHPVVATMISLLIEKQDGIWKRGVGTVQLSFAEREVDLRVFDRPVFTAHYKIFPGSSGRDR